ncbi:hypothetical protein TPENAI_60429 [Tenacibaculum litopenaei]|uniref:CARDB domain-containing protein n=1 Tax=Tenacibaculum litopenaei TaxID=396016 RepID=UPI0038953FB4
MKNFTFIVLFMATYWSYAQTIDVIDFKVNEPAGQHFNAGTKFDFEFKIKGDYRYSTHGHHQIDLIVYKESISAANELGRSYWNREDDHDLFFSTYKYKPWWNTALKNYATTSNAKFFLVVKYAGLTKVLSYTYPNLGKADLKIYENSLVIQSECTSCSSSYSNLGSGIHILSKEGGSLTVTGHVVNAGTVSSGTSKIKAYLSYDASWSTNDIPININANTTVNGIAPNNNATFGFTIFGHNIPYTTGFGYYYLILKADADNAVDEQNEANNTLAFRLRYRQSFGTKTYPIRIRSLNRTSDRIVNSVEQEKATLRSLPNGMYVIEDVTGSKTKILKHK